MVLRVAFVAACAGLVLFTGALLMLAQGDPLVLFVCALLGAGLGWVLSEIADNG